MRILLIEDSADKIARVVERLINVDGVSREDIDVAFTASDGRKFLREQAYSVLILDLVIPNRAGDSPTWDNAEELLIDLRDRDHLKKPVHIIGLTAYAEGETALSPIFVQQTWTIIRYDPTEASWSDQLERAIDWAVKASKQETSKTYGIDVCILTALAVPEFEAVVRGGWKWDAAVPLDDITFVRYGSFESNGRKWKAATAHSPRMGMLPAGLLASKIIATLRPKYLVLSGICAGIKGRANYGDPVVADPCWDWQSGKHVLKDGESSFEIRPDQISLNDEVRAKWEQLKADKPFWSKVKESWPGAPDTDLRVRLGPSVSGSSVLANADVLSDIKRQHGALVGLEMEAYGVLSAPRMAPRPRPIAFSCKSVCDFADDSKDDRWQTYAAYTSVAGITEFFTRYMDQLDLK